MALKILGISAFYHDSAAAVVVDGVVIAATQEERFTRKKHDPAFPAKAVAYCLEEAGLTIDELDAVVFYDKPLLKFERLLETYYGFSPSGLPSFIKAIPVWLKEKLFLKRLIREELQKIENFDSKKLKLLFPEHHLSHAASAFYPSPFEEAAILTLDGVGEWATTSICHGKGHEITILKELHFPHSVGLLYSAFTYYCGFKVNSGEYKLMGLAPYGDTASKTYIQCKNAIETELIQIYDDGSVWLNQQYFNYATGLRMVDDAKWKKLLGIARRESETEVTQPYCDLALAIQHVTENVVLKMAQHARKLTGSDNLCLAGGVALNCVANGKLIREKIFKQVWIQPASGDAGGSLGAALAAHHIFYGQERVAQSGDAMRGGYLGPENTDKDVELMARRFKAKYRYFSDFNELAKRCAEILSDGNVLGWHQGRMEFGPRALGGRSILGDARNSEMQKKLNLKIKFRESFRPFAPSVLAEDCKEFFEFDGISPYMLVVEQVTRSHRKPEPANYHSLPLKDKLYHLRSTIPAVTHIDYTGRIQTVHRETNPRYHALISEFKKITGFGLVVNTSFNVRGEPIVCAPIDSYKCFMRTNMDFLVIGNYLFTKTEQPEWTDTDNWKEEFKLD